jgi:hypothetical protein
MAMFHSSDGDHDGTFTRTELDQVCNISALWVIDLSNFNWALAKSGVTKYRNTLEDVGEPICNNESMSRGVTKWLNAFW